MARRKTLPDSVRAKWSLAERLSALRAELYGDRGGPELARQLGLPVRTWYNYESGVTVPAEGVLKIIELTMVEPMWLLHGKGAKFRSNTTDRNEPLVGPSVSVGTLLRTALQMLENGETSAPRESHDEPETGPVGDESRDLVFVPVDDYAGSPITASAGPKFLAAKGEWLSAERECRCTRVVGDAMSPIIGDGAYVAFSKMENNPIELDGKMVVAWIDEQPAVRWFQYCGRYAVLRAENPSTSPLQLLVDLEDPIRKPRFRRILWIYTPH